MRIIIRYPYRIRMDLDVDKDSNSGIWYPRGYDMDTICYLISADMPQSTGTGWDPVGRASPSGDTVESAAVYPVPMGPGWPHCPAPDRGIAGQPGPAQPHQCGRTDAAVSGDAQPRRVGPRTGTGGRLSPAAVGASQIVSLPYWINYNKPEMQ